MTNHREQDGGRESFELDRLVGRRSAVGLRTLLPLREAARLLTLGERAVATLVQRGGFRGFKVGWQWPFKRTDLVTWVERQKPTVAVPTSLAVEVRHGSVNHHSSLASAGRGRGRDWSD